MDFGALPPEINSGRMYSGVGAGSMLAAAAAWNELASELFLAASGFGSLISGLAGKWDGPVALRMVHAAGPYVEWLSATAVQAEQAAVQAHAAAAAYDAAFAAMVPPPAIVANRALLMSLTATNLLGQNSPAIATVEGNYEEMWAQDATAMYGYACASASASKLAPFTSPPVITDPAALARQVAAVDRATGSSVGIQAQEIISAGSQLIPALPRALEGFSGSATVTAFNTALTSVSTSLSKLSSLTVPMNFAMYPLNFLDKGLGLMAKATAAPVAAAMKAVESGAHSLGSAVLGISAGGSGSAVSAAVGRGMPVGALSVPTTWIATQAGSVSAVLPNSPWSVGIGSADLGNPSVPLLPLASTSGRGVNGPSASRFELRSTVIPRSPAGG
ncbi:PPE family protein [Mycobacterium sp. ML4]